jgi:hypothetical protein
VTRKAAWLAAAALAVWCAPARAQEAAAPVAASTQGSPSPAKAAPRDPGRPGSVQLSAAVFWLAPAALGASDANLTTNNSSGSGYRLFTASGTLANALGLEARVAFQISRMFAVEGGLTYSRPEISLTVTNDAEGAAGFTASGETISQFFVDASLLVYPMKKGFSGGRARPFFEVGAGHLRELHGQTGATSGYFNAETGQVYHVGGGVKYYFKSRPSGFVKAYGLRVDGRVYIRNGGFTFDASHPTSFAAGAGLVIAF